MKVLVSIIFHVTVSFKFLGLFCTFSKNRLSLTHCSVKSILLAFQNFSDICSKLCCPVDPTLVGSAFFVITNEVT